MIVCIGKGLNSVGQSCRKLPLLPVTLAYVIDERVRCWSVLQQQSCGLHEVVLTLISVDCIFLRRFYGGVIPLMAGGSGMGGEGATIILAKERFGRGW